MTLATRTPHRIGLLGAAALALVLSAAPRPALALDDDGKENIFSSMIGLLMPSDKEEVNVEYRERAPLVVPKNRDVLPPPQPKAAERAKAWPKDQEIARREAERAAAARPRVDEVWNPVGRSELDKVRSAGGQDRAPPADASCNDPLSRVCDQASMWSKLRNARSTPDEKRDLVPGVESARQALTDPPVGYRKPTTAQKYTFEVKKDDDIADARAQVIQERRNREER